MLSIGKISSSIILCLVCSLVMVGNVSAKDTIYTPWFNNLAIKGYDPVAYFQESKAIEGKKEFQTEWMGAEWRFNSAETLALFVAIPDKYAPQYGGYCAYAVADNKLVGIDPTQFTILDDKLYLNYNAKIQKKWLAERDDRIRKADQNWPVIVE